MSRVRISFPAPSYGSPGIHGVLHFAGDDISIIVTSAEWQSGYAAVCKTVYLGSIPGSASKLLYQGLARVAELVDARDLKSLALTGVPVRFRPRAPSLSRLSVYL
tara:strand:+ start:1209 stop:1523 length:315 start_codon:yes stop_codon:yes gene_type:complete